MRRSYQMFTLSFLDILSGALGAILFMFIIVDKGSPNIEVSKQAPIVYLKLDTLQGKLHGLEKYLDTLSLEVGTVVQVVVSEVAPLPENPPCPEPKPCPSCPPPCKDEEGRCPKPDCSKCPKPEKCPDCPIPCDDPRCPKQASTVVYKGGDPIEIPYEVGFAISNSEDISRDLDLRVCKGSSSNCVSFMTKNASGMRWIDLNKTGFLKPGVVTGGEVIFMDKLEAGEYTIYAKYDRKRQEDVATTTIKCTVATKLKKEIKQKDTPATLNINGGWLEIMKVSIDANGNITQL